MLMKKMEIKTTMQKDYFKTFHELDFWLLRHWCNFSFSTRKSTAHHLSKSEPDITHQHHPIQLQKL